MSDYMDVIIPVGVIGLFLFMLFKGSTKPGTLEGVKNKITKGGGGGGSTPPSSGGDGSTGA